MTFVSDKEVKVIKETFVCARPGCEVQGVKTTHNQKYCSHECCRLETYARITRDYHEQKEIKNGKKRQCLNCATPLSRYNTTRYCSLCTNRKKEQYNSQVLDLGATIVRS